MHYCYFISLPILLLKMDVNKNKIIYIQGIFYKTTNQYEENFKKTLQR